MNTRSAKPWLSLPLVLTAALLTLQAQPVTLQYNPADGTIFNIVETVTRTTELSGSDSVTDVRERTSVVTAAPVPDTSGQVTTPDSNTQTTTPDSPVQSVPDSTAFSNKVGIESQSLTRNGETIASPMHAALSGLELTYHLDANGKLLEIAGYDELSKSVASNLPDKLSETLLKLVNHDTLLYQDKASYEEVYGPFTDGSVTPVVNAVSAAIHALPYEGSVVLYAVSTIAVASDGKINVTRTFNTDAAALATQFDGLEEATISAATGTLVSTLPSTYTSASVTGSEQVVVAATGALVESRTFSLASEWTLQAPAGTTAPTHRVEDTREFTATVVPVSGDSSSAQP